MNRNIALKIGDLTARIPVIQGGMGVGVSLSSLAGSVASACFAGGNLQSKRNRKRLRYNRSKYYGSYQIL